MRVTVNGIDLACQTDGPDDGPVLVLGHTLATSRAMWRRQIPHFAAAYRVISFDMRGHGESAAPDYPYSLEMLAEDVVGVLDSLGVERPAIFLGISIGGHFVRGPYVALAAIGVAAGIGVGVVLVQRSSSSSASAAPIEPAVSVVAATPRLDVLRSDLPTVPPPEGSAPVAQPPEHATDAQVDVALPKAPWRAGQPSRGAPAARQPVGASPPAASPAPTSTTYVPPVRNPGF